MESLVEPLLPVLLFFGCAIVLAIGLLIVALALNPGRSNAVADIPYESGMDPVHEARRRLDVRFFLVAIAFLVFDVELLFLYPWAVALGKEKAAIATSCPELRANTPTVESFQAAAPAAHAASSPLPLHYAEGRWLFFGGLVFLVLLLVGFIYDWRKGVFQWR